MRSTAFIQMMPRTNIRFDGPGWTQAHPSLSTFDGRVYVDAATVKLTLADGSTATLPAVEGFFLGSLDKGTKVTQVTAYNDAGAKVARTAVPSELSATGPGCDCLQRWGGTAARRLRNHA